MQPGLCRITIRPGSCVLKNLVIENICKPWQNAFATLARNLKNYHQENILRLKIGTKPALECLELYLRAHENLAGPYRSMTPLCTVPALKSDDCIIVADYVAIADYLKTIQPEPPFIGVNAIGRALMLRLNNRAAAFLPAIWPPLKPEMGAQDPSSASRAQVS